MTASRASAISLTALLALAGCGGGGSHSSSPGTPITAKGAASQTAPVTFTFIISKSASGKNRSVQSTGRQPKWITAATAAIKVTLTAVADPTTSAPITPPGGLPQSTTFQVTATNGNPNTPGQCGTDPANAQNIKCTETIFLPVGNDSLTIAAYDGFSAGAATGNIISQQRAVAAVLEGANTFSFTLDANSGTFTVTPPGGGSAAFGGASCPGPAVTASGDISAQCTADITGTNPVAFTVTVADAHGTTIPLSVPGAPALGASSSNNANFTVSMSGNTLTVTPHATLVTAVITLTATPPNTSGPSPGDGLAPIVLKFSVKSFPSVSWKTRTATGLPRQSGAAAFFNSLLYVAGGQTKPAASFVTTGSTQMYDPSSNTWSTLVNMNVPRYQLAGATLFNFFFVSGGRDAGGNTTATLEQFDPSNPVPPPPSAGTWTQLHDMLTPRQLHGSAAAAGLVFAFGGTDATNTVLNSVEAYSFDSDTWTAVTSMPTARADVAVGMLGGFIYVIGGFTQSSPAVNVVERYDPINDAWTTVAPLPAALHHQQAAAISGRLYVAGGLPGAGTAVYAYDPSTNSWATGPAMPIASNGFETSAAAPDKLYVVNLGPNFDQLLELSSP